MSSGSQKRELLCCRGRGKPGVPTHRFTVLGDTSRTEATLAVFQTGSDASSAGRSSGVVVLVGVSM